jgi:hypothetical protein
MTEVKTKGLPQDVRFKLLHLCSNASNAELALQLLKGFKHLTLEQRKEVACTGLLIDGLNRWPKFKRLITTAFDLKNFCVDWRIDPQGISIEENDIDFLIADRISEIKELGYKGRRVLSKNGKKFVQFYCGRSKPSLEIEIK